MCGSEVMCSKKLNTPWSIYRKFTLLKILENIINRGQTWASRGVTKGPPRPQWNIDPFLWILFKKYIEPFIYLT